MELKELQKLTAEIIQKVDQQYQGKHDAETTIIHLLEELFLLIYSLPEKKTITWN